MTDHLWRRRAATARYALEDCALCGIRTSTDSKTGARGAIVSRRHGVGDGPECPDTCEGTAALMVHAE